MLIPCCEEAILFNHIKKKKKISKTSWFRVHICGWTQYLSDLEAIHEWVVGWGGPVLGKEKWTCNVPKIFLSFFFFFFQMEIGFGT